MNGVKEKSNEEVAPKLALYFLILAAGTSKTKCGTLFCNRCRKGCIALTLEIASDR